MKKLRVVLPFGAVDMPEEISPDIVKPVRKRRAKVLPDRDPPKLPADVYVAGLVGLESCDELIMQRIRDGDFLAVIKEVGSTEYNRLRLLALK